MSGALLAPGADAIYGFLQSRDPIDIDGIAGKADPLVTLSQANGKIDIHIRWYPSFPVDGQTLPAHQAADIIFNDVPLTIFVQDQDFHLI